MNATRHPRPRNVDELRSAWRHEMATSRAERDADSRWQRLERAHILSQPFPILHTRTHVAMLARALRSRDRSEALGQLFRLLVAAPGSPSGRYPLGNTGGANVSAFAPMPIPDDLAPLLSA